MAVNEFIINERHTSLYVLLPIIVSPDLTFFETDHSNTGLCNLIGRLSDDEGMRKLRNLLHGFGRSRSKTAYSIRPTFAIERNLCIRDLLRALGGEQLLTSQAIEMDHYFTDDDQSVHLSNAVHRAHVKFTENNITASAITLITEQASYSNKTLIDVNCKFPFLWLIYDKMNMDILYCGVFNEFD